MNAKKIQTIIEKLRFIINTMPDISALPELPRPLLGIPANNRDIIIAGDGYDAFSEIRDMFKKETGWSDKFSREYLEEEVIFPLLRTALISSDIELYHEMEAIVSKCDNYTEEHTAFLLIEGISMKVDQFELGKITLRNMKGAQFIAFAQQVESEIVRRESVQEKRGTKLSKWHTLIKPFIEDKVVAVYLTVAEPTRAQEKAEQEWERVVDILRYFAYNKRRSVNIDLPWKRAFDERKWVIASSTYEFSFGVGPVYDDPESDDPRQRFPFEITEQTRSDMQEAGIFDLIDMYCSDKKTDFSKTLLTGIHWFVNAFMQTEPANEFLSLVVCLETFLTRDIGDTGSISNAIAVGYAWVMGQNLAERKKLHKEIKELYGKRGSITHAGRRDDLADDLLSLRKKVEVFLQEMVKRRNEFKTGGKEALQLWIDEGPLRVPNNRGETP